MKPSELLQLQADVATLKEQVSDLRQLVALNDEKVSAFEKWIAAMKLKVASNPMFYALRSALLS